SLLVLLWDLTTGEQLFKLRQPTSGLSAIAFSPDGKTLAAGGGEGDTALWEVTTGKLRQRLGKGEMVRGLAFSPDGKVLAAADAPRVRLWDLTTGKELPHFQEDRGRHAAVAFLPDGKALVTADHLRQIHFWDPVTGKKLRQISGGEYIAVS